METQTLRAERWTRGVQRESSFEGDGDTDVDFDVLFGDLDLDAVLDALFDALMAPAAPGRRLESDAYELVLVTEGPEGPDQAGGGVDLYLVDSSRLFEQLVRALGVRDDETRQQLDDALRAAGTRPDALTPEDLWFLLPHLEGEVLPLGVGDEATRRRARLDGLLRQLSYDC